MAGIGREEMRRSVRKEREKRRIEWVESAMGGRVEIGGEIFFGTNKRFESAGEYLLCSLLANKRVHYSPVAASDWYAPMAHKRAEIC